MHSRQNKAELFNLIFAYCRLLMIAYIINIPP